MELVISIVTTIFVGVFITETYAWLPKISQWVLERAVRRLRAEDQERYREEWARYLEELPNTAIRLGEALSFYASVQKIKSQIVVNRLEVFDKSIERIDNRLKKLLDLEREIINTLRKSKQDPNNRQGLNKRQSIVLDTRIDSTVRLFELVCLERQLRK